MLYEASDERMIKASIVQGILGISRDDLTKKDLNIRGKQPAIFFQQKCYIYAFISLYITVCYLRFPISFSYSGDSPELTDIMLTELSRKMTSKSDLRLIGLTLHVDSNAIDRHLHNERYEISEAAYKVLREWRNRFEDKREAYSKLRAGLRRANMSMYVGEILEKHRENN